MSDRTYPLTTDRTLAGRYRLVSPVARGGMAEVWEAVDDVLARPVAVKILHSHLADDDGFVERFRREAVAAARLTHPGIVATYDAGADDGVAFIVMELVRGRTLRQSMEQSPLPPREAVRIAADVADALEHAHRAGLVHRDVKPANILLCEAPAGGVRVKVADFGIAKLQSGGGDLTATGALVGTAKYLSPEQVEGRSPDARSDVYALGVVLYEMLCGRPPFSGDTELATAMQHVQAEPPRPRQVCAGIPRPLEQVVLRAMAKEPDQRYQSAADLRGALLAVDLADDDAEPFVVRDPTPPDGIVPVARRSRRAWAPALLVVLLVVAAGMVAVSFLPDDDTEPAAARPRPQAARVVTPTAAEAFDPQGDRSENDDDAPNVLDGNPETMWSTLTYESRQFGRLKEGLGLVLTVPGDSPLRRLEVQSPTSGWAAAVYVADRPSSTLADWGEPVDTKTAIDGNTTFDLQGRRGAAVLLWITDPGEGNKARIAEVSLRA
ncbi:MAG TPA: protein kinase [Acidimicrobiales bacterium]|nr:protein kinase [Acidimicrobiales bacterium]